MQADMRKIYINLSMPLEDSALILLLLKDHLPILEERIGRQDKDQGGPSYCERLKTAIYKFAAAYDAANLCIQVEVPLNDTQEAQA